MTPWSHPLFSVQDLDNNKKCDVNHVGRRERKAPTGTSTAAALRRYRFLVCQTSLREAMQNANAADLANPSRQGQRTDFVSNTKNDRNEVKGRPVGTAECAGAMGRRWIGSDIAENGSTKIVASYAAGAGPIAN
jgi:hypothetical protein